MKADVFDLNGKKVKSVNFPKQFDENYNFDLINRAILSLRSNLRQPYGTMPRAGMNYSAKLSRRRRDYKGAYGKGIARVPRKTIWRRGTQFMWVGALAPGTVGGRKAHPSKASKIWNLKINKKERRKAIRSALNGAAGSSIVVVDNFENVSKAKESVKILKSLGFGVENVKRNRAGRGKSRGRVSRYKKGALVVVSKKCKLFDAISNIPGYDVVDVRNVNADLLTLGKNMPRKCIFTESALNLIDKEGLFLNEKA